MRWISVDRSLRRFSSRIDVREFIWVTIMLVAIFVIGNGIILDRGEDELKNPNLDWFSISVLRNLLFKEELYKDEDLRK